MQISAKSVSLRKSCVASTEACHTSYIGSMSSGRDVRSRQSVMMKLVVRQLQKMRHGLGVDGRAEALIESHGRRVVLPHIPAEPRDAVIGAPLLGLHHQRSADAVSAHVGVHRNVADI